MVLQFYRTGNNWLSEKGFPFFGSITEIRDVRAKNIPLRNSEAGVLKEMDKV